MNRDQVTLTAEVASKIVAESALIVGDAPPGSFLDSNGIVVW